MAYGTPQQTGQLLVAVPLELRFLLLLIQLFLMQLVPMLQ
jgi:hypothetical protein